jgi:hypothetical protein
MWIPTMRMPLHLLLFALVLMGCQKATETKSNPTPIWFLESYDATRGFTFTKNTMVEYVATCLEPSKVVFTQDPATHKIGTSSVPDCTDLLQHARPFEALPVTIAGDNLSVAMIGHEYHFKIMAVRRPTPEPKAENDGTAPDE